MTDREKIADWIEDILDFLDWDNAYDVADHLIANGVTVQRWIPVTERLPDRDSTVLAFYETMRDTSAAVQTAKGWNLRGTATHWMPLPEPPKEGE